MDTVPVTLLLPIRNGVKHLKNALGNLERCARDYDEILIIDDNSTDQTLELIQKWCAGHPNRKILSNPGNGLVSALNFGFQNSQFEWVARFDADDIYSYERLEKQTALITDDTVAIFSDYNFIDSEGCTLGRMPSAVFSGWTELSLISSQRVAHPSALLRKSEVLSVGGYFAADFPAEDLGLWLRLAETGHFKSVPEALLSYLISTSSISGSNRRLMQEKRDSLLLEPFYLGKLLEDLDLSPLEIFKVYMRTNRRWERTLFLIRDLDFARKKNLLNFKQTLALHSTIFLSLLNPFTLVFLVRHYQFAQRRKRARGH